jgi:hypothetical protein
MARTVLAKPRSKVSCQLPGWNESLALLRSGWRNVAVGIRIAPYPPHRSVRADFPHTALASGGDAQTVRRIRMADMGRRQPAAVNGNSGQRVCSGSHDMMAKRSRPWLAKP